MRGSRLLALAACLPGFAAATGVARQHRARGDSERSVDAQGRVARGPSGGLLPGAAEDAPLLFVGVFSAPLYVRRREEVRESWVRHALLQSGAATMRFVVGSPESGSAGERTLQKDMAAHNDILRLPVDEGYHNLVNKTATFLRWFAAHGRARYLMKMDDDVYPDLGQIANFLRGGYLHWYEKPLGRSPEAHVKVEEGGLHYIGNIARHKQVLREGRWAESRAVWPEAEYPPYAEGPGYILSASLVSLLNETNAMDGKMLSNEDTSVGVWVHRAQSPVVTARVPAAPEGCWEGVFLHMNLRAGQLRCMWAKELKGESSFCCNGHQTGWEERNAVGSGQEVLVQGDATKMDLTALDRLVAMSVRVFIYDLPNELTSDLRHCMTEQHRVETQEQPEMWIHKLLEQHPQRTLDPADATLFYVPFYGALSATLSGEDGSGRCKGLRHEDRTQRLVEQLRSSGYFTAHPEKHAIVVSSSSCPESEAPSCNLFGDRRLSELLKDSTVLASQPIAPSGGAFIAWPGHQLALPNVAINQRSGGGLFALEKADIAARREVSRTTAEEFVYALGTPDNFVAGGATDALLLKLAAA